MQGGARAISALVVGGAAAMALASAAKSAPANAAKQAERLRAIIKKAAIQCYSLEGEFPDDIFYLKHYGIVFDTGKYYYRYESNGIGNYVPEIYVVPR